MARKPGGSFMRPKTKFQTNIFDEMDEITITFLIEKNGNVLEKKEVVSLGTKLKDLKLYHPESRHYLYIDEEVEVMITKEQVFTDDSTVISK